MFLYCNKKATKFQSLVKIAIYFELLIAIPSFVMGIIIFSGKIFDFYYDYMLF